MIFNPVLQTRHESMKRAIGSPVYEPVLNEDSGRRTESSALPNTEEGKEEKKRRERIKALQIFLRILVNGRYLKQADGLAPLEIQLKPTSKEFDFAMQVSLLFEHNMSVDLFLTSFFFRLVILSS